MKTVFGASVVERAHEKYTVKHSPNESKKQPNVVNILLQQSRGGYNLSNKELILNQFYEVINEYPNLMLYWQGDNALIEGDLHLA